MMWRVHVQYFKVVFHYNVSNSIKCFQLKKIIIRILMQYTRQNSNKMQANIPMKEHCFQAKNPFSSPFIKNSERKSIDRNTRAKH